MRMTDVTCKSMLTFIVFCVGIGPVLVEPAFAQNEAVTFESSFAAPVFDQIDQNGVDLVTGVWRVRTPILSIGGDDPRQGPQIRGLEWTGQSWTFLGHPSLWRDGSKHIVSYRGNSYAFNGRGSNYSKRDPIDGSKLECQFELPQDVINHCIFTSRDGDKVVFAGIQSTLINYGTYFGLSTLQFGNLAIQEVVVSESALGSPAILLDGSNSYYGGSKEYGDRMYVNFPTWDPLYNAIDYTIQMGNQRLRINTPNNSANGDHYLRPKNTTQTVTDDFGNQWRYTFNGSRELTAVTDPGGSAAITATYYDNGKVKTISTPAGVWNYSYTTPDAFGTTSVINPLGEVTYVKYHREHGYVTEARDGLNRLTVYLWNASQRLERVTYPAGNYTTFQYDSRGNIRFKIDYPADGGIGHTWQAEYQATCTAENQANCNSPIYVIDPNGNRTDFEYLGGSPFPTKVIGPAASPGGPRPTVTNTYNGGRMLVRSSACKSQETCIGTPDEVVTDYEYFGLNYSDFSQLTAARKVYGFLSVPRAIVVTSDGQSQRTCFQVDSKSRRTSMTPPSAGLVSCEAATYPAVGVNSNPPENGPARTAPTFPPGS